MSKASGVLQYRVVNRGNSTSLATAGPEGHVQLVSGWQGDVTPTAANQTIALPIATNHDGSPVTGPCWFGSGTQVAARRAWATPSAARTVIRQRHSIPRKQS